MNNKNEAMDIFDSFGIQTFDEQGNPKSVEEILYEMSCKWNYLTDEQKNFIYEVLVGIAVNSTSDSANRIGEALKNLNLSL